MKKITKEEKENLVLLKGRSSRVRTAVMHLKPGEILQVDKQDWKPKNGPQQMCAILSERTKTQYEVSALANRQGWIIERIK